MPPRIKVTTLKSQLIHLIQELSGRTLRDAQYEDPATKSYLDAFAKLEAGNSGAMAVFAVHVGRHADDQLASFHLKRLLNGATSTRIVMD